MTVVLGLGVGASAKGADGRVLAAGFDLSEPPGVPALIGR